MYLSQPDPNLKPSYSINQESIGYRLQGKAIEDIKLFLRITLATLIRFYNASVPFDTLNEMKEDLVQSVTNRILNKNVYRITYSFFRLETLLHEKELVRKYKNLMDLKPESLGISKYFRLDKTSGIEKKWEHQKNHKKA